MPTKSNSNNSNSANTSRGNNHGSSARSSSSHSGVVKHSAVHKPVPGKGGKGK